MKNFQAIRKKYQRAREKYSLANRNSPHERIKENKINLKQCCKAVFYPIRKCTRAKKYVILP